MIRVNRLHARLTFDVGLFSEFVRPLNLRVKRKVLTLNCLAFKLGLDLAWDVFSYALNRTYYLLYSIACLSPHVRFLKAPEVRIEFYLLFITKSYEFIQNDSNTLRSESKTVYRF